jgi:hypothetical protein
MTVLKDSLRQMLAALHEERQALAAIDLDGILLSADRKSALASDIAMLNPSSLDEEARGMVEAAHRLNEANRRTRNLLAANVSARLDMLTGRSAAYCIDAAPPRMAR